MASPVLADIAAAIAAADPERFLGMWENEIFEAKGPHPYDLDSPSGRYEFAKDISAFANSTGGYILIGLAQKRAEAESRDVVVSVETMKESEFPTIKLRGIAKSHVYPPIKGLDIKWVRMPSGDDRGLGVVLVPPQMDDAKYFLVSKVVEGTDVLKENVVGVFRRVGADNVPLSAVELYRAIQRGSSPLYQRISRIEEKIDRLFETSTLTADTTETEKLLGVRMQRILEDG